MSNSSCDVAQCTPSENYVPIFHAGQVKHFIYNWRLLTSDPWVIACALGMYIPFYSVEPTQAFVPYPFVFNLEETSFLITEIENLLKKGVIKQVNEIQNQWVSNVFLRPKPDGNYRMILDLTDFNTHVEYKHFKMFGLKTALNLMHKDCWLASIDLKDAYYSVPIAMQYKRFLRFYCLGDLFEFQVIPNGLANAPRFFTKLLKPIFADMGKEGYICFPYIDDSFILGFSRQECELAVATLTKKFNDLGFVINTNKSQLKPSRQLTFLGFNLNSETMMVNLPEDKIMKFIKTAETVLNSSNCVTIRTVASLIGLMVSYSSGVHLGAAHFKSLEIDKILALKRSRGNFNNKMWLSQDAIVEIHWWLRHIYDAKPIVINEPETDLFVDASLEGWGAHVNNTNSTGGRWNESEETNNINFLELKAILYGLQSFYKEPTHIRIHTDSTTALAYVKNMGGTKSRVCNDVSKQIWTWAEENNSWLSVVHIPGIENVLADLRSRKFSDHLEWELSSEIFGNIVSTWGKPEIDLFATRLNNKVQKFVSWEPQPSSWATNAFSISWDNNIYFYVFPPFSLLLRVLRKIQKSPSAKFALVMPDWPTQPAFTLAKRLASQSLGFRKKPGNLVAPVGLNANILSKDLRMCPIRVFLFLPLH